MSVPRLRSHRWQEVLADPPPAVFLLLLMGLLAVLFAPALLGTRSIFYRDFYNFHYPLWKSTADAFARTGSLPLWDPLNNFGQPAAGNPNYLLFYPPAWIRFVMNPLLAYNWFVFAHLFLGGWAFRNLVRRWGLPSPVPFWGGLAYPLLGAVLSLNCVANLVPYVLLLPLVLTLLEGWLAEKGGARLAALSTVAAALLTIAEPLVLLGAVVVGLGRIAVEWRRQGGRILVPLFGAGLLAIALVAPALHEEIRLFSLSFRAQVRQGPVSIYERPLALLPTLWVANPFSHTFGMSESTGGKDYTAGRPPYLISVYVGFCTLALVALALTVRGAARRRGLWAAGAAVVFLFLAAGSSAPLGWSLLARFPVLANARYPEKLMLPASGALLLVALWGLARLGGPVSDRRERMVAGIAVCAALVAGGLAAWWPKDSSGAGLFPFPAAAAAGILLLWWMPWNLPGWVRANVGGALLVVELLSGAGSAVPLEPVSVFTMPAPVPEAIRRLLPESPGGGRVVAESFPAGIRFGQKWDSVVWQYVPFRLGGIPYCGMAESVPYAFSEVFDWMATKESHELYREYQTFRPADRVAICRGMGVRFIVSVQEPPGTLCRGRFFVGLDHPVGLWEVPGAFPRAGCLPGGKGRVRLLWETSDEMELDVEGDGSPVVVRDTWYPGWRAWVDGRETQILPFQKVFRQIPVGKGLHRVLLRYAPSGLPWACLVSLMGGLGILCLFLSSFRRHRFGKTV